METTISSFDIISSLIIIGILAIVSQEIKIIISIIKLNNKIKSHIEERKIFKKNKFFIAIFIGFIVTTISFLVKLSGSKIFIFEFFIASFLVSIFSLKLMKHVN